MGADLGVVLDRAAERIILIDERAREIPADTTLHLLLRLVARHCESDGKVLLPANASMVAAQIVEREGLEVVHGRISPRRADGGGGRRGRRCSRARRTAASSFPTSSPASTP